MRLAAILLVPLLASLSACSAGSDPVAPTEAPQPGPEVGFWSERLDRDPYDYIARIRVATALMSDARATGDHSGYVTAEGHLRDALGIAPDCVDAHVTLAFALSAQHRFVDARKSAERALELDPDDTGAWAALGDALLETGDTAGAARAYGRVADDDRGLFALSRSANVAAAEGRFDEAVTLLREAADVGESRGLRVSEYARCRVLAGDIEFQRGRWDEAEALYQKALEAWPNGTLPLEHLAELSAAQGRLAESRELYRRAISRGSHPELSAALAVVCDELGEHAEAARLSDAALDGYRRAIDAGDVGYLRHLALHLCDTANRPAEALPFAARDAELRPCAASYVVLAWVRHCAGDRDGALRDMAAAIATGAPAPGTDAETLWRGGVILDDANDAHGREWLTIALARNPRSPHRAEIARRTASGH